VRKSFRKKPVVVAIVDYYLRRWLRMRPRKKSEPRSSGTKRKPKAKSTPTRKSAGISPGSASPDDEKEFQDIMTIVTDLERQLKHSWELPGGLQEETAAIRTRKEEAETLVTTYTQEIERIREDLSSLQTENERLMAELGSSEEERSEAAKVINRQKSDLEDRKQEIQSLQETLSSLESTLEVTKREAESRQQDSQEKIEQLEQDMGKLEERLKQRTEELSQASALIDDLKREKQRLESAAAHLERTRTNLGKIHDTLRGVQDQVLSREPTR
jgi:chromosome segregation ATPase